MSQLLDAAAGVANACEPIPGVVTGGQPTLAHLAALKRAGCEVILDIREPMEPQPFQAADAVPRRSRATPLCYVFLSYGDRCQYILISVILPSFVSQNIAPRASTHSPVRRRR